MDIKFFNEVKENDIAGGKGLSLAKMYQNGFNIPNGFIIEADIFENFLKENNIKNEIKELIDKCDINDEQDLKQKSNKILKKIEVSKMSRKVEEEIIKKYKELNNKYVAVRSSATSEDGKDHAWAGQLESFLNVEKEELIESIKKCFASVFTPRALFYRIKNEDRTNISVAVVIQEMIQSEISGIAFSVNPTTNNKDEMVIESVFGLGEAIVSGKVTPDTYIINKKENKIENKQKKLQKIKLVKDKKRNKWVEIENGNLQKLEDKEILELSNIISEIEKFYKFPVDVEWGIENKKMYILQCRPITTIKESEVLEKIKEKGNWNFYVSRKFNWFVENTEIYASLEKYQKEVLGFEIATQNYLCLNGDEYSLESDFEILCNKLDKYFQNDINFFDNFAKTEFNIVEQIKEYFRYIRNKDLSILDYKELAKEMEKFNRLYIESFIPGMTRPEDYLMDRLEKELIDNNFTKEDIENIFLKISTCPNYFPLSYSEEPLDLLKIAMKLKNGKDIEKLLNEHIEKYAWIKGPVEFEDTAFTKEDYLARLNNLVNDNIEEKIDNINSIRKSNDLGYEDVLRQYKFTREEKELIKAIRNFIFLRTYTTEYSDNLFYIGRHTIFKEISNRTGIKDEDLIMFDDKEILDILENEGNISEEISNILKNRKKGFAMIWINGEVHTVFGNESLKLQNEIGEKYKILNDEVENLERKVISGSIANKGKVRGIARILTSYKDIYKVKKGDIIVATMTTPNYVSAMEKASGFITDEGGITCHAAIISREFNVPCIVGTTNATKEIKDGQIIELDAYTGNIYIIDK